MIDTKIILIIHDVRSCHNVGSLLRIADGLGIQKVYMTGYTPYPILIPGDARLPHIAQKLTRQIQKTALGAETTTDWEVGALDEIIGKLRNQNYTIAALEQTPKSQSLTTYYPPMNIALIVGNEVLGLDPTILKQVDIALEIPMLGIKESHNVCSAAAMALYQLRFGK